MPLILLAEDDVSLSGLVKEALEAQGYKVEQAFDGQQAVQKAQEQHPDLLILDVQMPEIYGVGVYTTLQRQNTTQKIPVIFMSGLHRDTLTDILPSGPNIRTLNKPVEIAQLVKTIKELLAQDSGVTPTAKS